jgi:hypothetical protein
MGEAAGEKQAAIGMEFRFFPLVFQPEARTAGGKEMIR